MRNFRLIRRNLPVAPLLSEIEALAPWSVGPAASAMCATTGPRSLALRGLRASIRLGRRPEDALETRWTTASHHYPAARGLLEALAADLDGTLGRAALWLWPAGESLPAQVHRGQYHRLHRRHHLVLRGPAGSLFLAGGEAVRMHAGELWWQDQQVLHAGRADPCHDRLHLVFDLLPGAGVDEAQALTRAAARAAGWAGVGA